MKVRLAALVPVLAVGLTGCSADEAPRPEPLPSASSPSPSPVAQGVPPSAQAATPQGAAAFVSYYYEELGRAFSSLDSTRLRELSAPECSACANIAAAIDRERATGRRYTGGEVTIRSAEAVEDDPQRTSVTLIYDSAPLVQVSGPPADVVDKGQIGNRLEVQVVRTGASWRVSRVEKI